MGSLNYAGASALILMEDRTLAHVRAVVVTKLRRGESFALTLPERDGATETLWMHASIPLRFHLDSEVPLDHELLTVMMNEASSTRGLDLTGPRLASQVTSGRHLKAMTA
jgi:hypothetical protein